MPGTGPVPNPNSRRNTGRQAHTWTDLPAGGYTGPVPGWPFKKKSASQAGMWTRYWKKPQAAAWAQMGMVDEVAMYVVTFLKGVEGDPKYATEARQWGDKLGLTPASMLKNRWRIRETEIAGAPDPSAEKPKRAVRTLKVAGE